MLDSQGCELFMENRFINYDKPKRPLGIEETSALGIPLTGDYYYNFLNSKVKLTEQGLSILESVKSVQGIGIKSPRYLKNNPLWPTDTYNIRIQSYIISPMNADC